MVLPVPISLVLGLQAHATWLVLSHGFWGMKCRSSGLPSKHFIDWATSTPIFFFLRCVCVCVCVCVWCVWCVCVCVHECAYICGDQRLTSSIFLTFHCIFFPIVSSVDWVFHWNESSQVEVGWLASKPLEIPMSQPLQMGLQLLCRHGRLNSGLQACWLEVPHWLSHQNYFVFVCIRMCLSDPCIHICVYVWGICMYT